MDYVGTKTRGVSLRVDFLGREHAGVRPDLMYSHSVDEHRTKVLKSTWIKTYY